LLEKPVMAHDDLHAHFHDTLMDRILDQHEEAGRHEEAGSEDKARAHAAAKVAITAKARATNNANARAAKSSKERALGAALIIGEETTEQEAAAMLGKMRIEQAF